MSTSATSPSSSSALTQTFTGVSKFATSLQSVLARSISIAQLPLDAMENTLTDLQTQQSAVQSLDTDFLSLQQSISSLQSTVAAGSLSASVSDGSIASATVSSGATAGTYTLSVQNLGDYSTALSNPGSTVVTDPTTQGISSDGSLTLTVGGTTTTITPASSSLQDLVTAINSQAAGQVQATLVNVGSTASPDYRLSLQAVNLGTDPVDISDSSGDLIASSTPGQLASYTVDGATVTSNTDTVTLSPGLTVNLLGQSQSGQNTTISVVNDPSSIASALSSFATAYNAASTAISQSHGQNGTVLEGSSLLQELGGVLSQLGTYSNGSPNDSLANFGVTVDETGQMSVDTTAFTTAANANWAALQTTLGSATTSGFLQTATNLMTGLEDPTNGIIKQQETDLTSSIAAQQTKITNEQANLTTIQNNLTAQISQADATIASLESQVTYVTGLFATFTSGNTTTNSSNGLPTL